MGDVRRQDARVFRQQVLRFHPEDVFEKPVCVEVVVAARMRAIGYEVAAAVHKKVIFIRWYFSSREVAGTPPCEDIT